MVLHKQQSTFWSRNSQTVALASSIFIFSCCNCTQSQCNCSLSNQSSLNCKLLNLSCSNKKTSIFSSPFRRRLAQSTLGAPHSSSPPFSSRGRLDSSPCSCFVESSSSSSSLLARKPRHRAPPTSSSSRPLGTARFVVQRCSAALAVWEKLAQFNSIGFDSIHFNPNQFNSFQLFPGGASQIITKRAAAAVSQLATERTTKTSQPDPMKQMTRSLIDGDFL